MIDVSRTFTVSTAPPAVVRYLTDWGNSREWDPGTVSCRQTSEGPVAVGTEWRNVLRLLRREVVVHFRLEHADDGRLVFSGHNRGATSTDTITCTALACGGTSITYASRVELHGLARWARPLLLAQFERIGDRLVVRMTATLARQG